MATGNNYPLPVPPPLEIHDSQAAEKWKRFKRAWTSYSLATELDGKDEKVQVATLLRPYQIDFMFHGSGRVFFF